MRNFKIGDIVIVNENGNRSYTFTKKGSIGKIRRFFRYEDGGQRAEISFTKLTGGDNGCWIYDLSVNHIELCKKRVVKVYGICDFVTKYYK